MIHKYVIDSSLTLEMDLSNEAVFPPMPISLLLAKNISPLPQHSVLDVGTGSGILAITAAKRGAKEVVAIDIALEAIKTAALNARINKVEQTIEFVRSDYFAEVVGRTFDLIVSNPPCMPFPQELDFQNKGYRLAVDGGTDGTEAMIRVIEEVLPYLKPFGTVLFPVPKWSNWRRVERVLFKYFDCMAIDTSTIRYYLTDRGYEFVKLIENLMELNQATVVKEGNIFVAETIIYNCRMKKNRFH